VLGSSQRGKKQLKCVLERKKTRETLFTNHTSGGFLKTGASERLNQDKLFGLPQQVALIYTDDPIKCPNSWGDFLLLL